MAGEVDKSVAMFFKKLDVPDVFSIPTQGKKLRKKLSNNVLFIFILGVSKEQLLGWLHTLEKANVDARMLSLFRFIINHFILIFIFFFIVFFFYYIN